MRNTRRKLKKIYSYYLILLIILSLSTITYVYFTLKDYQKNDTDKYLVKVLNNLSDNDITNNFSFNDNYETKDVTRSCCKLPSHHPRQLQEDDDNFN